MIDRIKTIPEGREGRTGWKTQGVFGRPPVPC
jgi:hypothetical protein